MPYADPDPTDPMTLHGVALETETDDAMVEMAVCFIEEYARLGFDEERIWKLFHTRGYAGPALAIQTLGAARVRDLISQEVALRRPRRGSNQGDTLTATGISLPVLQFGCC